MIYKNCLTCGEEFGTYPSIDSKCCSQSCGQKLRYTWSEPHNKGKKLGYVPKAAFKKGQIPWNKGIKGYNSGQKHPNWGKKLSFMQKEKNPNWRGGIALQARFNEDYRKWRSRVFARDNYTCQVCDAYGVYLHADHLKNYADYPELRYDVNNGRTLCVPCHYYVTFKKKMPNGIIWGQTKRRMPKL